jgi:hypothetical protein
MKNLIFVFGLLISTLLTSSTAFATTQFDDDDDDKTTIGNVFSTLMQAEKVAEKLDMLLVASDEPVTTGLFLFMLQSKSKEALKLQLFDDQNEPVGNNLFSVVQGKNYNSLNVNSLNDGVYTVKFLDNNGKELTANLTVQHGTITQ